MLGEDRRAVVVVARIFRDDAWVRLAGQRGDYVGERIVSQPGQAVVVGLARPHSVTRNRRVALGAGGGLARVVPHREEGASRADRKVGLPLRTGSSIGVQFEWRAKGHATVG